MSAKRFLSGLFILLCFVNVSLAAQIVFSENFETAFAPGVLPEKGESSTARFQVRDKTSSMSIVRDRDFGLALQIGRGERPGNISFFPGQSIPAGRSFRFSFDVKISQRGSMAFWLGGKGKMPCAGVRLMTGSSPSVYDEAQNWVSSGIPVFPSDTWVKIQIEFNASNSTYEFSAVYPGNEDHLSLGAFPLLGTSEISELRFLNSPPAGSTALIDNIVLETIALEPVNTKPVNGKVFRENFDSGFSAGSLVGSGRTAGGKYQVYVPGSFFLTGDKVFSPPLSLKVERNGNSGYLALRPQVVIPDQHNYEVEFYTLVPPAGQAVVQMFNSSGIVGAVLYRGDGGIYGYDIFSQWESAGEMPRFPVNTWTRVRVKFFANEGCYRIYVTYPGGKTVAGDIMHPALRKGPVNELRFISVLPQKNAAYFDDIKVVCDRKISLSCRKKHPVFSSDPALAALLENRKSYPVNASALELELSPAASVQALQLSGRKLPTQVTVSAINSGGHHVTAGTALAIDPATGLVEFPVLDDVVKLQLRFTGSGVLDGLSVFSPISASQGERDLEWSRKLDAEYDLPVYDLQYAGCDVAGLTFDNHTGVPLDLKIVMYERLKKKHYKTFKHRIPPGRSQLEIDLKSMPDGEYVTGIIDASGGGRILRLLRLASSPECSAVPRRELTGEKIHFPDGFFLESFSNICFTTGVAKPHLVKRGTPDDDSWVHDGTHLGLDKNGRLAVNFQTLDRLWRTASVKKYYACADPDTLSGWQIFEGSTKVSGVNPLVSTPTAAAKPDWNRKKGKDGKITYRFYDAKKDGPIKLNQLRCEYISSAAEGRVGHTEYDWKVLSPEINQVWTVWYKAPGEALIVGQKPLTSGFPKPTSLEPPDSGSDLGFGQWLSDDGKTLYFGFGRHLIRHRPYRAEYDNMDNRARMIGIWRTRDGINWEQRFIAPPDKSKPVADQHYGGFIIHLPNAAGLKIAILNRYAASTQQISWEVVYSWDSFRWTRLQNAPQLLENGPFGDWTHGGGYLSASAIVRGGKVYQLMRWINDHYHFQSEIVHGSFGNIDHFTGDYIRNRYRRRKLEKWPYFQTYFDGSWEKLAEHTRNATSSVGIMEYRLDGYFYAKAEAGEAQMVTHPVRAAKALHLNAQIHDDGYIEIALLDKNNLPIPGYRRRLDSGDSVAFEIFPQLPKEEFKVELKLRNADVYTLNF